MLSPRAEVRGCPSDDTRFWVDVLDAFPGIEGSILIDRLLGAVVARARHADEDGGGIGMSHQDEG